ncbi:hypothetical protein CYMTET_49732 [Cymbomonas tetramitiformis]|uniref:Uncharacterized protein n=1 Tax=Cymbomonas tetramitiformis TaxID=36881 RepID=A0AAE0ETK6_9CHLO|nr:hypothetical protein CYMTET_49732 [Cymbomonas tetramitiformis]
MPFKKGNAFNRFSKVANEQDAATQEGQALEEQETSEPPGRRSYTRTPPASNRDTAKLERMQALRDIAETQIASLSQQVEDLKEQLGAEKQKSFKFKIAARNLKARNQSSNGA